MEFRTSIKKFAVFILLATLLTACDSGGNVSKVDTIAPNAPTVEITAKHDGSLTINGTAEAGSTVTVIFPDGSQKSVITDSNGRYSATSSALQPKGEVKVTSTDAEGNTSEVATADSSFIPRVPTIRPITADDNGLLTVFGLADSGTTITVTFPDGSQQTTTVSSGGVYTLISNTPQNSGRVWVASTNTQGNTSANASNLFTANLDSKSVLKALYLSTGTMPELTFTPSLGVNTEGPQGGADTAGMPMPFVDIFRTARPFTELSPGGTLYDANGWPTEFATGQTYARTKLLQGALDNSIPEGKYTVLYDDNGRLEFGSGGLISNVVKHTGNKYTFDLDLRDFDGEDEVAASDTNAFNMNIRDISAGAGNYMKNIRIIMPGGTCTGNTGNPFIRVEATDTCPTGSIYESFEERLQADRNAIIFNPNYLLFLRNFKVVRMMNLMEASLKKLCYSSANCPAGVGTWDYRAKMDDAVWGGNDGRTADEDHKGVPVSVMIALANTLKRDIWVNMPHVSTNDYVTQYAKQVSAELDSSLKVYIEYSNEVWNPGFAAHAYSVSEGTKLGLDTVPAEFIGSNRDENYFARLRFYSQRAVEIFKLWETEFGAGNTRIVRVLGSFIGDRVLTEQMLKHVATADIDSIAIAPYFFGCPYRSICPNAAKTLTEATTVDDIFNIIDQSGDVDVKSLDGTINAVKNQLTITNQYNLKLISYEGGQHLVTGVLGNIPNADKPRFRKLFNDANRDPRMKERYVRFLNGWKDLSNEGTSLFTLYTMPQSYYRFGNFGLKEHLNKARAESPKFDGVMSFQEAVGNCWWDEAGCTP